MKRSIAGFALLAGLLIFAGCGFEFVARSQNYGYHSTPGYCYDCHSWPAGVSYSRCSQFEIRVAQGGYYYRPYHHGHQAEYTFVKISGSDHESGRRADHQVKSNRGRR